MCYGRTQKAACLLFLIVSSARCAEAPERAALKLKPASPCPALAAAAQTNHISLDRMDSLSGTNALHAGDCATVLVTFVQKEKRTQWLLYLETAATDPKKIPERKQGEFVVSSSFGPPIKFQSKRVPAKLRLIGPFVASGAAKQPKVEDTHAEFSLNEGFDGEITSKALLPMKPTAAEQRAMCGTFPALFSYVDIVQHTEGLEGLFFKLVEMPSVWSMIRHVGVTANLSFGNKALPSPANPADWNLPASAPVYYFPFLLRLNDQPALKITLAVTSPQQPLLICGGVVGLLAEKVDDEQSYMSMRLVSARSESGLKRK
jgi:hypothetical protein